MSLSTPRVAAHPPAQQFLQRGEFLKTLWDTLRDEAGGGRHALVHLKQGGAQHLYFAGDGMRDSSIPALASLACDRNVVAAWLGCGQFAFLLRNCCAEEARSWVCSLRHALPATTPAITVEDSNRESSIDIVLFEPRSQSLPAVLAAAGMTRPWMDHGPGIREIAFG